MYNRVVHFSAGWTFLVGCGEATEDERRGLEKTIFYFFLLKLPQVEMLGLPRTLWREVARFGFVIQGLSLWVVVGRSVNSLVFFY